MLVSHLHAPPGQLEAVAPPVDGRDRIVEPRHFGGGHIGRVGQDHGEPLAGPHRLLQVTLADLHPIGQLGLLGVHPGPLAGPWVPVHLDQPASGHHGRDETDLAHAGTQFQDRPARHVGDRCRPLALFDRPRPRRQTGVVEAQGHRSEPGAVGVA